MYLSNKSGVYRIVNIINNKCYVGQAINIRRRKNYHFSRLRSNSHYNQHLQDAFNLYGESNFIFEILEIVEFPQDFVSNMKNYRKYLEPFEQKWIDFYQAAKGEYGYNGRPAAGSPLGCTHNELTLIKMGVSQRKRFRENPITEETKNKISESQKGEKSYHWGTHPADKTKGIWREQRQGKNHPMYGKHHTEESNEKNRQSHLGKYTGENNPMYGKSGELSPNYGLDNTISGKELFLHFPNGKHYFVLNNKRFCKDINSSQGNISSLGTGRIKSYKGITGERAPKWLVDKVLPLMKSGQFWVEIDTEGNILGE